MKKILSILLAFMFIFSACSLASCEFINGESTQSTSETTTAPEKEEYSVGLEFSLSRNKKEYAVSDIGTCTDVDIIIPSEYNGKPVTQIADNAFYNNRDIKSVTIPDSVTYIGQNAFAYCTSLVTVNLPESVTEIDANAFMFCESLKNIELHAKITYIGTDAFLACTSLKHISIPAEIGLDVLYIFYAYLSSLKSFEIAGESDQYYIIDGNLYGKLHNEVYFLGYAMNKEESTFIVPSDVDVIAPYSFSFYPFKYTHIENQGPATWVKYDYDCNLKKVVISEGTSTIMSNAFTFCIDLRKVVIPHSIVYIESGAFNFCQGLSYIEYNGTIEEWEAINKGKDWYIDCPITTIKCIDGEISTNGTIE